jgi:hypothetical protein
LFASKAPVAKINDESLDGRCLRPFGVGIGERLSITNSHKANDGQMRPLHGNRVRFVALRSIHAEVLKWICIDVRNLSHSRRALG